LDLRVCGEDAFCEALDNGFGEVEVLRLVRGLRCSEAVRAYLDAQGVVFGFS
jgi:hypothetical protein